MSYLVVMVVDTIDQCLTVMDAWELAGATGITILPSTGLGRVRKAGLWDSLPLMPSLQDLFEIDEIQHRTIFSVVDDQAVVDRLVQAAQTIAGDMDEPHSGFLFVVPVLEAYGMGRNRQARASE